MLGQWNKTHYKRTGVCNVIGIMNCYISNKETAQTLRNRYGISIFSLPDCCRLQVRTHPEGPATDRPTDRPAGHLDTGWFSWPGFVLKYIPSTVTLKKKKPLHSAHTVY
jgi:hypothetical protein